MKKYIFILFICLCSLTACTKHPKNMVWIIGDGMGPSAMGFFMEGVRNTHLPHYPDQKSTLEKFIDASVSGFYFDNTYDTVVTDSACAATQMACGHASRPGYIGLDADQKTLETIMEQAYKQGKSVGVITDVYVADATPAGFLTHATGRTEKYEIARQLVASKAQVVLGGGLKYFNQGENIHLLDEAKSAGWTVVTDKEGLTTVKEGRVLGLFAPEAMPFYGDMANHPHTPTLLEMTQKAIEILSQNKNGFFLMVEAGKVDWALHDNEAGPFLWEMINLDETLAYVWQFAKKQNDTFIYLNADHETGVPSFEYRHLDPVTIQRKTAQGEMLYWGNTDYVNYPYYQNLFMHKHLLYYVYPEFKSLPPHQQTAEQLQQMVDQAVGVPTDLNLNGVVPDYNELIAKLNQAQGMVWSTKNHSSGMLIGVANGPQAALFHGVYHNTDIKGKLEKIMGF